MAKYWIILYIVNKSEQARHRTSGVKVKALIKVPRVGTPGFLCWINPNAYVRTSSVCTGGITYSLPVLTWLRGDFCGEGPITCCCHPSFRSIFSGVSSLIRCKKALQTGYVQLYKYTASVSCLAHTKHGYDVMSYRPPLVRNPRSLCCPLGNMQESVPLLEQTLDVKTRCLFHQLREYQGHSITWQPAPSFFPIEAYSSSCQYLSSYALGIL